jgi:hypothetical protein
LVEVPIIDPNDPDKTEYDKGISNCDAAIPRILPQSFTTGNSIATKGVLLKKIDKQKHVIYIRYLPSQSGPDVPNVLRANQSTICDFSTAPITKNRVPIVMTASFEKPRYI